MRTCFLRQINYFHNFVSLLGTFDIFKELWLFTSHLIDVWIEKDGSDKNESLIGKLRIILTRMERELSLTDNQIDYHWLLSSLSELCWVLSGMSGIVLSSFFRTM